MRSALRFNIVLFYIAFLLMNIYIYCVAPILMPDYEYVTLNGTNIDWAPEIKHLGNHLDLSCTDELDCRKRLCQQTYF